MTRYLILFSAIMFLGCGSGNTSESTDSGTSISATGDKNPCLSKPECAPVIKYGIQGTYPQVTIPCGWDKETNTCYASRWCEPSVASRNSNGYSLTEDKNLRPESAVCPAGTLVYTYPANGIMLWGDTYTTRIKIPELVGQYPNGVDATAYVCKLYPDAGFAISC